MEKKKLNDRNNKLQNDLNQAKQDITEYKNQVAELKKQLNEFDDSSKQLSVQITKFVGDQSDTLRKEVQEKDDKIEKLQQEKLEVEMKLERLKEEMEVGKSALGDLQKQNETQKEYIKTLTDDKNKLDNRLVEEMNFSKVKIAEVEAEQDILNKKLKDKDDLIKKYDKQVQDLREQLATSVPSDQASTTLIMDVDKRRKHRQHSLMLSYQEGLMNRPVGLYRSTSESSLPNGDVSRSSDLSRSDSEHSQFGELLGKEIPHGKRSGRTSEPRDHVGETVEATTKVSTESEPDYAAQLRSSTPVLEEEDKRSGRRPSDRTSGSRYGDRHDTRDSSGRDKDRDADTSRTRASDRDRRSSDRTRDRDRSECKQN